MSTPIPSGLSLVEFKPGTLRFLDHVPAHPPEDGFLWLFLDRPALIDQWSVVQNAALCLGGSNLLDLHCKDLSNESHPSHYDFTSVYDLVLFRRLATAGEVQQEHASTADTMAHETPGTFQRISTRALGFVVFDRLLISVHPKACFTARLFIDRYLSDAVVMESAQTSQRSRLPQSPADLMLRMLNLMVDSYLDLRRKLTLQLEHWQTELLNPRTEFSNWTALMAARSELHTLENLCEEQHDAMQEWLDTLREQPLGQASQAEYDSLIARTRDVIEHIDRVRHHVRRLEQSAETVVQIHFSAQSHRTNNIMRTLTALTAVFLPLNLITGFFGMNFEFLPLIHAPGGLWWALGSMVLLATGLSFFFWRKRYLSRSGKN